MTPEPVTTNEAIKAWMTREELNQTQAARRLGVPLRTFTRWLRGGKISKMGQVVLTVAGVTACVESTGGVDNNGRTEKTR